MIGIVGQHGAEGYIFTLTPVVLEVTAYEATLVFLPYRAPLWAVSDILRCFGSANCVFKTAAKFCKADGLVRPVLCKAAIAVCDC